MSAKPRLHIAVVIPTFRRGSGGHNIIFKLIQRFERMGHTCSIWFYDPFGERRFQGPAVLRGEITEHFAPLAAPVFNDFSAWYGADVVMATGWQTVYPALSFDLARARVYLVNDHEPEFHATSVESVWATETYRLGLHGIAGSPWLRELLVERYGGRSGLFQYGVEHDVYFPRPIERRRDTIVFYARTATDRRAVALGVLALTELRRRRPGVRIVMFGDTEPFRAPFSYDYFGIATPEELAWVFSEATVGLCLSMTNYSLMPQEMLACGLPCVDIQGASAESVFGRDGAVELAAFDADAIADAMERLLDDEDLWHRRSEAGRLFVTPHTWDAAAEQVEAELRTALRLREEGEADTAVQAFARRAPSHAADAGRSPDPAP
jgi:glycosyltransferase involved in cell wall biosynthesis